MCACTDLSYHVVVTVAGQADHGKNVRTLVLKLNDKLKELNDFVDKNFQYWKDSDKPRTYVTPPVFMIIY